MFIINFITLTRPHPSISMKEQNTKGKNRIQNLVNEKLHKFGKLSNAIQKGMIWFWQWEMACPCSSHLFCLQLCSDIVNGLISAVFIAVVKASFFDKSVIQLKSKLTVTRVSILETWDSIWTESRVSRLLLSGTVLCLQQAFSPLQARLHQEIVLCQSCIDLLWMSGSNLLCWSCSGWSAMRNFLS